MPVVEWTVENECLLSGVLQKRILAKNEPKFKTKISNSRLSTEGKAIVSKIGGGLST